MQRTYALISTFFLFALTAHAQQKDTVQCSISYIAASTVYVDAGRERHIAVGDTLSIVRSQKEIGVIVVIAVSGASSAANIVAQHVPFAVGDKAIAHFISDRGESRKVLSKSPDTSKTTHRPEILPQQRQTTQGENVVSGRIAIQYNAIFAEESRFNVNQPAASVRLNIGNLLGTGMRLAINGRSYYDAANNYSIYGSPSGLKSRAYEVSLLQDAPDAAFGYGVGRLTSRYVGGMGTFDGAQLYYRFDHFTAGILGGAQVLDRTLTFSQDGTKGSFFLYSRTGADVFHQYDGTVAYGRQMVSSLDRQFLYTQNSLSLGSELMLYESSEIELNDIANGARTSAFKLSNTFLNVNYQPVEWLYTNVGYDALRNIYLFETMKAIPDSLIDRSLVQGFRASATMHLPSSMTLSADASLGSRQGGYRNSHSFGASLRAYDLLGSEVDGGVRYSNFLGAYSDGDNITLDLDRSFGRSLTVELRYEYSKYHVSLLEQLYATQTVTADVFYRLSSAWFTSLSGDYLYDPTMTSFQFYAELGFRF
jgi:hypothetical protein